MSTPNQNRFQHNVGTDYKPRALVEVRTYDVWGNAKDGYEVNDSYRSGTHELPARVFVSNLPSAPKSLDGSSASHPEIVVHFEVSEREILRLFGPGHEIDDSADSGGYEVVRRRDQKPVGRVEVVEWLQPDQAKAAVGAAVA